MKVLGAVLAGGESRRFGSDKAEAILNGRTLIEHAADALASHCDAVVVCDRRHRPHALDDRPCPGLGPLGGLCAALAYGAAGGFDAVLSVPCDVPDLPPDLLARLSQNPLPTFVADLPIVGLWPCALSEQLDLHLRGDDRSMRGWARAVNASAVELPRTPSNINTPDDLAAYHG